MLGSSSPLPQVTLHQAAGGSLAAVLSTSTAMGFINNLEIRGGWEPGSWRRRCFCVRPRVDPPSSSAQALPEPVHQVAANLARPWPRCPAPAPSP